VSILHLLALWSQRRKMQQDEEHAQDPHPPKAEAEKPPKDNQSKDED
jgi:hypothetical protein